MRERKVLRTISFLLLAAGMASCAAPWGRKPAGADGEKRVLATVGDRRITEADFLRALARVPPAYREKYLSPEGKRQLLRSLIEDELFYTEGKRLGIDRSAEVEAEVDDFRKRIVRERMSDHLKKKVRVDEADIQRYYRDNREKYAVPERLRLSVIMVGLSKDPAPEEMEQAQEKVREVVDMLKEGEEFERLAQQLSDHSSASKGGDLGFQAADEIPPDIAVEALALPSVGEVSGPVRGELGLYIVKLTGKQPEDVVPYEEVKGEIGRILLKESHDSAYKELLEKLEEKAAMEVDDAAVDRIGLKPAAGGKQ